MSPACVCGAGKSAPPSDHSSACLERMLAEAKKLLADAYLGGYPTNGWRKRVEALGAWPRA